MKREHLKAAQIRAHLANSNALHTPGHWSKCPACARVYYLTLTKMQRAEDCYRRDPSDLAPVRTVYDEIVYILKDARLNRSDGSPLLVPIWKRNGMPHLSQRNREADYIQVYMTPANICPHDRAAWKTYTDPEGTPVPYCPVCSPFHAE